MDLIVQPDDGVTPVLDAIAKAKKSLDLLIFRFDLKKVEEAVEKAVDRGIAVRALIAHTNKGEEKRLRQLEQRMLDHGVTVSRTGDEFVRYHGKFLIVDREELQVFGFNYTELDVKSRSFGLITRDRQKVQEALRLFEADSLRQEYQPECDEFIVSPENSRELLATFIKRAKKSLAIYDPKLSDAQMLRLLSQRQKAGVDVRVIGKVGKRANGSLRWQKLPAGRLHVRAIIRDGDTVFTGSQSLRALELDARREVGLIVKDPKVVKRMLEVFDDDWSKTDLGKEEHKDFARDQKLTEDHEVVAAVSHT